MKHNNLINLLNQISHRFTVSLKIFKMVGQTLSLTQQAQFYPPSLSVRPFWKVTCNLLAVWF